MRTRLTEQVRLCRSCRIAIRAIRAEIDQRRDKLHAEAKWWQKLIGHPSDQQLGELQRTLLARQQELQESERKHSQLETAIENAKKTKKRFLQAQIARNATEAKNQSDAQRHEAFRSQSAVSLGKEFDRSDFRIHKDDYRRGNQIDNYFRNHVCEIIFSAFNKACAFCGATHDLTFDHYALPKNEGGNFVLISTDGTSIRVNIVVLCRGCNGAKGQSRYFEYFSETQRATAHAAQQKILNHLMSDGKFLKLIKKWGSRR